MNRKERRTLEKKMGKDNVKKVGLMLSLEKCLTCEAKFDKRVKRWLTLGL